MSKEDNMGLNYSSLLNQVEGLGVDPSKLAFVMDQKYCEVGYANLLPLLTEGNKAQVEERGVGRQKMLVRRFRVGGLKFELSRPESVTYSREIEMRVTGSLDYRGGEEVRLDYRFGPHAIELDNRELGGEELKTLVERVEALSKLVDGKAVTELGIDGEDLPL